ncbi:hypothetical protein CVT26_015496 [Gymnopilus dilepis]|uniref:Uncharacterized protein n=1 Tax=Gymnopilus dilepis TaxID=231916 RepID=A0A409WXI3_9AGAR|nr:hypothetical protein CVT26_015496 [Gymnopilus dilepis]
MNSSLIKQSDTTDYLTRVYGAPATSPVERAAKRKQSHRKYYEKHKDILRVKARERAARAKLLRLETETPEEAEARKIRLRQAAARYREACKYKPAPLVCQCQQSPQERSPDFGSQPHHAMRRDPGGTDGRLCVSMS